MASATTASGAPARRALATRWRVVDIVVAAVLGVACGVVFWAWGLAWTPVSRVVDFIPPGVALLVGPWLFAGTLGALVVRRPGAAIFTELVAGVVEALLGDQFGLSNVYYGLVQGAGAELFFALFLYRRFGLGVAVLGGAGAGAGDAVLDIITTYPRFSTGFHALYVVLAVVSGMVFAGVGSWLLVRAIAATGALAPLASGRSARRV